MVLKLDLVKEYDKSEWSFIQDTLQDVGQPSTFTSVIMTCVTSGYYRLLWNGEATDPILLGCGLRHGDPLSPYLFVVCMERLAQWIEIKKQAHTLRPIRASRGGLVFSNLFFADDMLLFSEATEDQAMLIRQGLELFCKASAVSYEKYKLFFSSNVSIDVASRIVTVLGVPATHELSNY